MTYFKKRIATPTGKMTLVATAESVCALVWDESELPRMGIDKAKAGVDCAPLAAAEKQLGEYFRGERKRFDLPLEPHGTPFQQSVWAALRKIPFGKTWSYRDLAHAVGNPGAMRAVGTANGRNPLCIFIPCHRVVRASGEIGGYAGGVERKIFLLNLEKDLQK